MITGRRAIARLQVSEPGEVIELDREQLLALIQTDAELSEILMRAFIMRRLALIARDLGDVVVIGSTHSAGTLRRASSSRGTAIRFTTSIWIAIARRRSCSTGFRSISPGSRRDLPRRRSASRSENAQIADCLASTKSSIAPRGRSRRSSARGRRNGRCGVRASEGLDVLVFESSSPGVRPGPAHGSRDLGFPTGISGLELTGRAYAQALKFGARVMVTTGATRLSCDGSVPSISRRPSHSSAHGHHRERSGVPQAGAGAPVSVRGGGRLLRRDTHGGPALRR